MGKSLAAARATQLRADIMLGSCFDLYLVHSDYWEQVNHMRNSHARKFYSRSVVSFGASETCLLEMLADIPDTGFRNRGACI